MGTDVGMELQIQKAESMGISKEVLEFLMEVKKRGDWRKLEWYYLCAVDHMPVNQMRQMEKADYSVAKIRQQRMEYLKKLCLDLEPLHKNMSKLQKEVEDVCQESLRIRNTLEKNIEAALEKQYEAQKEANEVKDKLIQNLEQRVKELQEELDAAINRREAVQAVATVTGKRKETEAKKEETIKPGKVEKGLLTRFWNSQRTNELDRFVDTYLKDDRMSDDQKNFLLDCLEEGMNVKQIEKIASPDLSLEVMQRLKAVVQKEKSQG